MSNQTAIVLHMHAVANAVCILETDLPKLDPALLPEGTAPGLKRSLQRAHGEIHLALQRLEAAEGNTTQYHV